MNKYVLGSVAAAAGIALLLGGAGSLALWNDEAVVNAGTVNSGTLTLTSEGDGGWSENVAHIVPGDSISYTETFTVVAVGDHLNAQLTSDIDGLDNDIDGVTPTTVFTVTKNPSPTPLIADGGVYSFGAGTYTVKVVITVAFDVDSEGGQSSQLDLGAVKISLDQV